jgi:hypothetical protein
MLPKLSQWIRPKPAPLRAILLLAAAVVVASARISDAQTIQSAPVVGGAPRGDGARAASNRPFRLAQAAAGNVGLGIIIDAKMNQDFVKADRFHSLVYEAITANGGVKVQISSKKITEVWKGNAPLLVNESTWDDETSFAPVFLIADVRNDGTRPVQITAAYLDIAESQVDYQPYLTVNGYESACSDGSYGPKIELENYGWGEVRNARLVYSLGKASPPATQFTADLKTFDLSKMATVEDGLRRSGVDIDKLKIGKFHCSSKAQVPGCFAQLKKTGIFGDLAANAYVKDSIVFADLSARIEYQWQDADGRTNNRSSPFSMVIPLLHFDTAKGPECGAGPPVDRNTKPLELSLDQKNYRLKLDWSGQIESRQGRRYGFVLTAKKASHHVLHVVLEFADGNSLKSLPIDISYFVPRTMWDKRGDDADEKK